MDDGAATAHAIGFCCVAQSRSGFTVVMKRPSSIRIGAGAGFSGDRIDPAVDLAVRGNLDYLVFECLAERTIALAQREKLKNADAGYDPYLEDRLSAVLKPCVQSGVRIISNMGAAHPIAAARKTAEIAAGLGLRGLKVAAVHGDDVLALVKARDGAVQDEEGVLNGLGERLLSANAYLGHEPIVEALRGGADVVITGRVADPSLFLAPLVHEFDWAGDDWERLGRGTLIGHLLECAGQVSGGYFADPGFKNVERLAELGFPIAEVTNDGAAEISKIEGTGGLISRATCVEQMLYELHDPGAYYTPDVIADFSGARFDDAGKDRVSVSGAGGVRRPDALKVSVGYADGWVSDGQISYAGAGALERGQLALDIVRERIKRLGEDVLEARFDLIGVNAVSRAATQAGWSGSEVRARIAARTKSAAAAQRVNREVEALYTNGPAGGGGVATSAQQTIAIASVFIERAAVKPALHWEVVT